MAFDSLYIAYAKAHYPKETYVALIKFYTEKRVLSKVAQLKQEAKHFFNICVEDRKFGQDNREMNVSVDGKIYQSLDSIKGINREVGDKVYSLSKNKYEDCVDLYIALKEAGLTKTHITNLARINYFEESEKMIFVAQRFSAMSNVKKDKIDEMIANYSIIDEKSFMADVYSNASKETAKMLKFDDNSTMFRLFLKHINPKSYSTPVIEKRYWELALIGETLGEIEGYEFFTVEKYAVNRGSLLVLDKDNKLSWRGYKKNLKIKSGDILCVNKTHMVQSETGWKKFTAVMNLTEMYK